MSNGLLADVEARAQRRRTRTRADQWRELVRQSLARADDAEAPAEAIAWLKRALRVAPGDAGVALRLAGTLLSVGQPAEAAKLFRNVARRFGTPEAFIGLAAAEVLAGEVSAARQALVIALQRTVLTATLHRLAARLAGEEGWCGLARERLVVRSAASEVRLDGCVIGLGRHGALPAAWRSGELLEVVGPKGPLLGSPLPIKAFRIEGFVEAVAGGLHGWAWFPSDPGRVPAIHIGGERGSRILRAVKEAKDVPWEGPLGRPRRFELSAVETAELGTGLVVRCDDGRPLSGSPIDPGIEARGGFSPHWVDVVRRRTRRLSSGRLRANVIVPVHGGGEVVLACIQSILNTVPREVRVVVVDDASPDRALREALEFLARRRRIRLISLNSNKGFPAACNAGIRASGGRDIVVLNSDTLVPPGWLERLQEVAYSGPDIGTVTPLTNDGTVVSYPESGGGNTVPSHSAVVALDRLARRANGGTAVDLPVGVGFCMYVRRKFLNEVGTFREDLWGQGYGEENDLCLRGRAIGWRHVAAAGIFVGHFGRASFGPAREHLVRRNGFILERLHPGYVALVAAHTAADPLHRARRRMDALRWAARRCRAGAVVMITHDNGGGVARLVEQWAEQIATEGLRAVVLEPVRMLSGAVGVRVREPGGVETPNLSFTMPDEMGGLVRILRGERVVRVEVHHMLGHHAVVGGLAERLGVEQVSVVHDYARFCGRIALVSTGRRYCGEPDVPGCEACIADLGSLLEDDPPVRRLLERSEEELRRSVRVVAPSFDAAQRMRRHFPEIVPVIQAWEDDRAIPPRTVVPIAHVKRVIVVGAIGIEKGYEVLLACARDAGIRGVPIQFIVVGFTEDDERLMRAGPVFVTGEFTEEYAIATVREQAGHIAFIPSVWPETWCFALTRAWQAGLDAAVFDLGAQAERVRRTGRGWVLPLGMSAGTINETLLQLAPPIDT